MCSRRGGGCSRSRGDLGVDHVICMNGVAAAPFQPNTLNKLLMIKQIESVRNISPAFLMNGAAYHKFMSCEATRRLPLFHSELVLSQQQQQKAAVKGAEAKNVTEASASSARGEGRRLERWRRERGRRQLQP